MFGMTQRLSYLWDMIDTTYYTIQSPTSDFKFRLHGSETTGWWLDCWLPIPNYKNGGLQFHVNRGDMSLEQFRAEMKKYNQYYIGF